MSRRILLALLPFPALAASVQLDVRVADELGRAIPGAEVSCFLVPRLSPDPFNVSAERLRVAVLADDRGRARLEGRHVPDHLAVTARAEGFYPASRRVTAFDRVVRLSLLQQGPRVDSVRVDFLTSSLPADGSPVQFEDFQQQPGGAVIPAEGGNIEVLGIATIEKAGDFTIAVSREGDPVAVRMGALDAALAEKFGVGFLKAVGGGFGAFCGGGGFVLFGLIGGVLFLFGRKK